MTSKKPDSRGAWRVARKGIKPLVVIIALLGIASTLFAYDRRTAVVDTVAKAAPAVVNIRTEQIVQRRSSPFFGFGDSFFDEFFNQFAQTRSYRTQALGSGAIIDGRGYLVTNAHVVEKASKIYVALPGERQERCAASVATCLRLRPQAGRNDSTSRRRRVGWRLRVVRWCIPCCSRWGGRRRDCCRWRE